ncbi:MAG: type II secretion system protein [Desulfobacterales bacterium]|nr:MAG: type II secretion system protein [Desulfobacterales bacterium]
MNENAGFTLIEMIVTIVLIGIIGTFTTFFLYTGMQGFLTSKQSTEGALTAQIALDRISKELRNISQLQNPAPTSSSITYTSDDPGLPGTRKIAFNSGNIAIEVNNTSYILLEQVATFALSVDTADLDNTGGQEVSGIDVNFTLSNIGIPFNARIYPRNLIPAPP